MEAGNGRFSYFCCLQIGFIRAELKVFIIDGVYSLAEKIATHVKIRIVSIEIDKTICDRTSALEEFGICGLM
ncbi:hypothetical protein CFP56_027713 [Quercus suber]|uniref:Uncharacterized protein n=1 Tax=Quercus suber TaxID=58331 RepID=A0AAW0JWH0_QUESU